MRVLQIADCRYLQPKIIEMEPETEKIIENLRKVRISRKISLLSLANKVEISHSHLYYIESKKVIPSIDVIIKLAKALEISPKRILQDSP